MIPDSQNDVSPIKAAEGDITDTVCLVDETDNSILLADVTPDVNKSKRVTMCETQKYVPDSDAETETGLKSKIKIILHLPTVWANCNYNSIFCAREG